MTESLFSGSSLWTEVLLQQLIPL